MDTRRPLRLPDLVVAGRDIVWQWYDLQVPPDAPAGEYWLEVGIYDANAPGQPRVPIIGPDGKVADNHVGVAESLVASHLLTVIRIQ